MALTTYQIQPKTFPWLPGPCVTHHSPPSLHSSATGLLHPVHTPGKLLPQSLELLFLLPRTLFPTVPQLITFFPPSLAAVICGCLSLCFMFFVDFHPPTISYNPLLTHWTYTIHMAAISYTQLMITETWQVRTELSSIKCILDPKT